MFAQGLSNDKELWMHIEPAGAYLTVYISHAQEPTKRTKKPIEWIDGVDCVHPQATPFIWPLGPRP